jgi:hypothetical protein
VPVPFPSRRIADRTHANSVPWGGDSPSGGTDVLLKVQKKDGKMRQLNGIIYKNILMNQSGKAKTATRRFRGRVAVHLTR